MKNSVPPGVFIAIIVVVVLIVGVVGYRALFPNTETSPNSKAAVEQFNQTRQNSAIRQYMQGNGAQHGAYGGGSGAGANGSSGQ